ncbi:hypothetical protein A9Q84_09105 [Halobacteriovorax marinus]|uniref:histidine kinase n=1 Tax=Halobacteriovorax marinus TaxID=97084 RepID=A0A1Y5F6G5_9BACT|nr:hypothetical protein A9Q84_09105 [Halobacteriovorax marinus]
MEFKKTSQLSFELLKWILICSTFFTFLGTGVQLYTDYRAGLSTIESTLDQIDRSYVRSISNSLWNLDDEQIKIQVNGIIKLKDIDYIKISEKREGGFQLFSELGEKHTKNVINKEFNLLYTSDNKKVQIGVLHVQASLSGLFSRLFDKILVILVTQTLKTFIVSFCILYIIHILVSKKIMTLVEFAKQLRVKNLDTPILFKREKEKMDEIDELAKSMNQMRIHLKMSIEKMKKSEENIIQERDYTKGLINGSPYIICGLTPAGITNFVNPLGLTLTGLSENQVVGENFFEILGSEDSQDKAITFFEESRYTELKDFILPIKFQNMKRIVVSWSTVLRRDQDGLIVEIIGFGADVTEKVIAEEELKRYQEHLEVLVEKRTEEVEEKNKELEANLKKLKTMQGRMIAQEKLASLGSLTAGIAHELNNPLNFIINFAYAGNENCKELLEEAKNGGIKDEKTQKEVIEGLQELKQFNHLIHLHGKKSEMIIKSMLAHSRTKESEMSYQDLNALIEENVNFAFHALRSKFRGFNSKVNLKLKSDLSKVNVAKGEIDRVLLNMFTNAFYSMNLKKQGGESDFSPTLDVQSEEHTDCIVINIRDNGIGIPEERMKDVFDPFYTTKPAGEGTGLGLSLSYEIIVGVHQGELDLKSKEGEFAEFTIKIPKVA